MITEYSNEVKGKVYAYRFAKWEQKAIAKALKPEIRNREIKILQIKNHPKNEGQVTYQVQIEELANEIKILTEIIEEFKG